MRDTFVDYSALMGSAFGRNLVAEIREMARVRGTRESDLRAHLAERLAVENERRATQGINLLEVRGVAA